MRTALVALVIVVIALVWFNPDMEDFKGFVALQSERILLNEAGESELGRVLSGVAGSLAGSYVDRITERNNYFVFSTYTIDFDGAEAEGEEWAFVGIAGQFFEMDQPETIREREAGEEL